MRSATLGFLAAFLLAASWPTAAGAKVFSVTNNDELYYALSNAASNGEEDTIQVDPGNYGGEGYNFQYAASSGENFPISLVGAGAGQTIFSGGTSMGSLNFFTYAVTGSNASVTVQGITVQDVTASDNGGLYIFTSQSPVNISGCAFLNNRARWSGGGANVYTYTGAVTVTGSLFQGNQAGYYGGGFYAYAEDSPGGNILLEGNTFRENTSVAGGGAYLLNRGTLTCNKNIFRGNSTTESGGGLWARGLSTLSAGAFSGNRFIGNIAGDSGGGAWVQAFGITATDNVFAGNRSTNYNGGGAWFDAYSAGFRFVNNTLAGNNCGGTGGGFGLENGTPDVYNNIFRQNGAGFWGDFYLGYGTPGGNVFNNDVADYLCNNYCNEGGNINQDPLFASVTDPDAYNWDLSLLTGSPCINAGTAAASGLPSEDIEGNPRSIGPAPDMGAYESGIIFSDDFEDASSAGLWDPVLGTWKVVALKSGQHVYRSSSRGYSVSLIGNLSVSEARLTARLKIGASTAQPYASVIFNALSDGAYREVKIYRLSTGVWKMALLQKGSYDGDTSGIKIRKTLRNFKAAAWHSLSLDILPGGGVTAVLDGKTTLSWTFGGNSGGELGLRSVKTSVSWDDLTVSLPEAARAPASP